MAENPLLEFLLAEMNDETYNGSYYHSQRSRMVPRQDPEDRFHIRGAELRRKRSSELDPREFGELIESAYVLELINTLGLERGKSSEPRNIQSANWVYTQRLNPNVFINFDLDLHTSYLEMIVVTQPGDPIRARIVEETHKYMARLEIRQVEAPKD